MPEPKANGSSAERALLEALGAHVGRPARAALRRAMRDAAIDALPEDPPGLGLFICGPLAEVVAQMSDRAVAEALIEALAPLFRQGGDAKSSGVRRNERPLEGREVLMLSRSGAAAPRLRARLRGRVPLTVVRDVFALLDRVDRLTRPELTVVVAQDAPSIGGPLLPMLERAVPERTELVFWGAAPPETLSLSFHAVAASATEAEIARRCLTEPSAEVGARPPVVLADDDDVWRAVLERALRRAGYEVIARANGFEALEACIDRPPALLVTDLDMPLIDGAQLASLIASRFAPDPPPVLLVTSSDAETPPHVAARLDKGAPLAALIAEVRARVPVEDEG